MKNKQTFKTFFAGMYLVKIKKDNLWIQLNSKKCYFFPKLG